MNQAARLMSGWMVAFLPLILGICTHLRADETPVPNEPPWPAAYRDWRILDSSTSPDGRYAVIYLKRSVLVEQTQENSPPAVLVLLQPFRPLAWMPVPGPLELGRSEYEVNWAKDSSAVVLREESKWGPDKVFAVAVHNDNAGKIDDLTAAVVKLVRPDFIRTKAERYNDYYEFVFDREHYNRPDDPASEFNDKVEVLKDNWTPEGQDVVIVACTCTTDPKGGDPSSWSVWFEGVWNLAKHRFTAEKITRLPLQRPPDR